MEKPVLSKSTFIKGNQCLKALYLYKKRYFLRDRMPPERVATFTRGTRVGLFAQELFPGGIDCGAKSPRAYAKAAEKTASAIAAGQQIIYEACFISNSTLIFLDILVKKEDGWHAYEVKSSLKLSPTYYKDAALQYFVIKESGLEIKSFNLIHINPDYTFDIALDIDSLFNIVDVTHECETAYPEIETQIADQVAVLQEAHSPKIEIGEHCRTPYDCDFIGHCWKHIPDDSVFNLPSLSFEEQYKIYKNQGADMNKALNNEELSAITKAQLKSIINKESFVNEGAVKALTNENAALVKIFTFRPAIPLFNGTKPYQPQAYGFAVMSWNKENNATETKVYFSQNLQEMEKEVFKKLSAITESYSKLFTFQEDTGHDFFNKNESLVNFYNLFTEGDIIHPEIKNYRFITIYKALTGKLPWFKKVLIDQQAALIYEKTLRNNYEDQEAMQQIETYAMEWIKYFSRLYSTITKLK